MVKSVYASRSKSVIFTSVTCAASGPNHSQSQSDCTASSSPHITHSTIPFGKLRTQPVNPNALAFSSVVCLKNTPCTLPVTRQCLHSFTFFPKCLLICLQIELDCYRRRNLINLTVRFYFYECTHPWP